MEESDKTVVLEDGQYYHFPEGIELLVDSNDRLGVKTLEEKGRKQVEDYSYSDEDSQEVETDFDFEESDSLPVEDDTSVEGYGRVEIDTTLEESEGDRPSFLVPKKKVPSIQRRSVISDNEGFIYTTNKAAKGTLYLRCTRYSDHGCLARAILRNGEVLEIQSGHTHNHQPDRRRVAVRRFTQAFLLQAEKRNGRSIREIYNLIVSRFPEESLYVNYKGAYRSLRRHEMRVEMLAEIRKEEAKKSPVKLPNQRNTSTKALNETVVQNSKFQSEVRSEPTSGSRTKPASEAFLVDEEYLQYLVKDLRSMGADEEKDRRQLQGEDTESLSDFLLENSEDMDKTPESEEDIFEKLSPFLVTKHTKRRSTPLQRRAAITDDEGFMYVFNKITDRIRYLRCTKYTKGCPARAIMRTGQKLETKSDHNHPPDTRRLAMIRFNQAFFREAENRKDRSLKEIFNLLVSKYPDVAPYVNCIGAIRKYKRYELKRLQLAQTKLVYTPKVRKPKKVAAKKTSKNLQKLQQKSIGKMAFKPILPKSPVTNFQEMQQQNIRFEEQKTKLRNKKTKKKSLDISPRSSRNAELPQDEELPQYEEPLHETSNERFFEEPRRMQTRLMSNTLTMLPEMQSQVPMVQMMLHHESQINPLDQEKEELNLEVEVKQEVDDTIEDVHEMEEASLPPSELLPGPKGQPLYYDGVGYYYNQNSEDSTHRWLQCSHTGCGVTANMELYSGAPIVLLATSEGHAHQPNQSRRQRILFLNDIKTRHAVEDTPFAEIFKQEAEKNPVGASFFSFEKIENHLKKKISQNETKNESVATETPNRTLTMKTRGRPSLSPQPEAKKRKTEDTPKTPQNLSQKLKLLKSLQDITITPSSSRQEQSKPSERLPGAHAHSFIYHDGNGYYYSALIISGNHRRLKCTTTSCDARAVMRLEENAPISLENDSPAHNHPATVKKYSSPTPPTPRRTARKKTTPIRDEPAPTHSRREPLQSSHSETSEDLAKGRKYSEKLQGPEFFHDFKGNYYYSTFISGGMRHLRCLAPTCLAEARMRVQDDTEIYPAADGRPHNHKPDITTDPRLKLKQWEDLWQECLPSERLPCLRLQYCCYHDGRGYYYCKTTQADNIRYLTCMEPECPVRAHMSTQKDAPITVTSLRPSHTHPPDVTLRDALLFIDAVRVRVRSENEPKTAIANEAEMNAVGAKRVDLGMLEMCLCKAIEISKNLVKEDITEDELDFISCIKPLDSVSPIPSTENQKSVPNHFSSILPLTKFYSKKLSLGDIVTTKEIPQNLKSEKVPALLSDQWLYHDGEGYYYNDKGIHRNLRFLQCVIPKCGLRAWMSLEPQAPIRANKPHNHEPQPPQHRTELWFFHKIKAKIQETPDIPFSTLYRQEAEKNPEGAALIPEQEAIKLVDKMAICTFVKHTPKDVVNVRSKTPSERIPILWNKGYCYHDGQGFYYSLVQQKNKNLYLKCATSNLCSGRAHMKFTRKAPIFMTVKHNHNSDLLHKEVCLFTYEISKRSRDEDIPLKTIYEEESIKFLEAAASLDEKKVINKMFHIRRKAHLELDVQAEGSENQDDSFLQQKRSRRPMSEVLPGRYKPIYSDGKGFYFLEQFSTENIRYLMCIEPHCVAQAKMGLQEGAPILLQEGSPPHCHCPQPMRRNCLMFLHTLRSRVRDEFNVDVEEIYKQESAKQKVIADQIPKVTLLNILESIHVAEERGIDTRKSMDENDNPIEEEELWVLDKPAERLPCQSGEGYMFHDGRGYYYYCYKTQNKRRLLRCCELGCDATGWLGVSQSAAVVRSPGSPLHNHSPDTSRRKLLVFLHRVTLRAASDVLPVKTIIKQEAKLNPEASTLAQENSLVETLSNLTVNRYFKGIDGEGDLDSEWQDKAVDSTEEDEGTVEPCEKLHSASTGEPVYFDNKGFYFREHGQTSDKLNLSCLMPFCRAKAYILLSELSHIHLPATSSQHNHEPDSFYRNKLLFVHNVRQRVLNDTQSSINTIYNEEANREPIGADITNEVAVKNMLYKLRKTKIVEDEFGDFLFEEFFDTMDNESAVSEDFNANSEEMDDKSKVNALFNSFNSSNDDKEDGGDMFTEEEYLDEDRPQNFQKKKGEKDLSRYLPSEKLPTRTNKVIYHDGTGYYFHFNALKEKVMYLRCTEPTCKVRGSKSLDREDSPIIPTRDCTSHNHKPNFNRRKQLLFMHRCKQRAASENITLNEIWESEAARDPVTASQVSSFNVKTQMKRHRLMHTVYGDGLRFGDQSSEGNEDGIFFEDPSITDLEEICGYPTQDIHGGEAPERIPSMTDETLWHAAGFFYTTDKIIGDLEKVKCIEKNCNARAQIQGSDSLTAVIRLNKNTTHSHPPDLKRRNQLLFIDRCRSRAAETEETVEEIYKDEANKDPEVAKQLSAVRVKRAMSLAKQNQLDNDVDEEMSDQTDSQEGEEPHDSECLLSQEDGGLVYHDGSGHFYSETSILDGYRLLKCIDCTVEAKMSLEPDNVPIERLDTSTQHTHPPNLDRMNQTSTNDDIKASKSEPKKKIMPKLRPHSMSTEEDGGNQRDTDSESQGDERYTDYVTLEEDEDRASCDEEALNTDDDPDFIPSPTKSASPTKSEGKSKLFHDGNGYYFTLVMDGIKKFLQCKTPQCDVRVELRPSERPLLKLFNTSPVHHHAPDLLRRKQNLFLKNAALRSSEGDSYEDFGLEVGNGFNLDYEMEEIDDSEPKKNTKPSELVHGQRPNSFNYHDGNGYYFNSHTLTDKYRYLECVVNTCKARAYMEKHEEAPINLTPQSPAHNHRPDPGYKDFTYFVEKCKKRALEEDTPIKDIYEEESTQDPVSSCRILKDNLIQRMKRLRSGRTGVKAPNTPVLLRPNSLKELSGTPKSETLPGYRPNSTIYHDLKGYFFIFNALKENKRYLRCIEPRCRVRASMDLYDGAPIQTSSTAFHNHQPDFRRKNFVLFLQRCKDRSYLETDKPISQIYTEEAKRDPVSAAMISSHNLLQRMNRSRKVNSQYYPTDEDHSEFLSVCKSNKGSQDEDSQSQDEAYHKIVAEVLKDDNELMNVDPEIIAIENALRKLIKQSAIPHRYEDGAPEPEEELQPSEALCGLKPDTFMYYDSRGFYYVITSQSNVWYLKCIEPGCTARGHKQPEAGAPIVQTPDTIHNHRPDYKRRQLLLWMEKARQRAINESTPIPTIYLEEANRDTLAASLVSPEYMKARLTDARKAKQEAEAKKAAAAAAAATAATAATAAATNTAVVTPRPEKVVKKLDKTVDKQKKNPLSNVLSALVNYLSPNSEAMIKTDQSDENQTVVMVTDSEREDNEAVITIQGDGSEDNNTVYLYQPTSAVTPRRPTFCDDKGFCYQQTTIRSNTRYLKCIEKDCRARASMPLEDNATISLNKQSPQHNHQPDQSEFTMLLDSRELVSDHNLPIQVIYTDEDGGEQVALCHIADDSEPPVKRPYRQRQKPDLTIDPEELFVAKNVVEQVDEAAGDYYHNEEQQRYPLKPSEVIPGLRPDANNYHDGNGFYYELNRLSQNIRYLKCLMKDCKARAYMEVGRKNAPIIQTNFARHNHGPDLFRKQFTVFLHRVTRRAAEESTPINLIYQQEAERDPESASHIRMENVKQRMLRYRKKHRLNHLSYDSESGPESELDGSIYHFFVEQDKEAGYSMQYSQEEEKEMQETGTYEEKPEFEEKPEPEYEDMEEAEVDESSMYQSIVVSEVEIESSQQHHG